MIGILFSLMAAIAWAISSIISKFLTSSIDIYFLNVFRLWGGSIILIIITLLTGRLSVLFVTPNEQVFLIAMAGLIAISIGDTIYIKSLSLVDVSRAFPIAQCTFPVITMIIAILFLKEPFSSINIVGGFLVVTGIYLVVVKGRNLITTSTMSIEADIKGVLLAFLAAATWTAGSVILKIAVVGVDPLIAATIRIPIAALVLTGFVLSNRRSQLFLIKGYGFRNIGLAAIGGVAAFGIASVAFVTAMQIIGVGKTVLITAIAPILILPFSIIILNERPTRIALLGILTGVIGLIFISLD